jgi:hypothetical protein
MPDLTLEAVIEDLQLSAAQWTVKVTPPPSLDDSWLDLNPRTLSQTLQTLGVVPGSTVHFHRTARQPAADHLELLFSYGTLQLETVQMATFGRQLTGTTDTLRGFELVVLEIEDQAVIAISGKTHHTMARFTGRASDLIPGTVFPVTSGELQKADMYEVAAVKRVAVVLQSGVRAWAYVDARYAPSDS